MNHSDYAPLDRLRLLSRNEGKIKSYESCCDLRAWSHDIGRRNYYLREWIKTDMPVSVIPVSTVIHFVKEMTCTNKGKTTPRCHPRCKSKVILESICKSCNEMKECFKNEMDFDKYFQEEEFDTGHWPCETCLEALKSIKMFWTIIIEKLFKIKISKTDPAATQTTHTYTDCVRCVAKVWQTEMVQQALFVRNITHFLNRNYLPWKIGSTTDNHSSPINFNLDGRDNVSKYKDPMTSVSRLNLKSSRGVINVKCSKFTEARGISNANTNTRRLKITASNSRKVNKHILWKQQTADVGCECTTLNDEIAAIKANFNNLKEKSHKQDAEIEKLTVENDSLKTKLQSTCKENWWDSGLHTPSTTRMPENITGIEKMPKPYEVYEENCYVTPIKHSESTDSEIIITMKNCKNESYKHISLLQVLHKTNASELMMSCSNDSNCKKEDPLLLLAKVQSKFGAIVHREMNLVHRKTECIEVDADYHQVNSSRSDPSCSRTTFSNSDSGLDFKSARDVQSAGKKNAAITIID